LLNNSFTNRPKTQSVHSKKATSLKFSTYLIVMSTLGFIPSDYKTKKCLEETDLEIIWKLLSLDASDKKEEKTIKAENLFIFLAALLNI